MALFGLRVHWIVLTVYNNGSRVWNRNMISRERREVRLFTEDKLA